VIVHPTQLNERVVTAIRLAGVDVHAHGVNDAEALALVARLEIAWIDTDEPELALKWREHN
jgi:glycerophosphoryl diester phosphodiesterase